jgi:hypothetical protein
MSINFLGMGAAYEGANADMDNQVQQARLKAQEDRAQQDQDYLQYQRNIAQTNRAGHLADAAAIKAKYDAMYPDQQSSAQQSGSQQNTDGSNQSDQSSTQTPLFKVGGLKTSVPVNVVSPQSGSDGSNQSAQPAQPAQSTNSAPQASASAGTPAQPAQDADSSGTPAIPIAVPDSRATSVTQTPGDSSSGASSASTQGSPTTDASATANPSTTAPAAQNPSDPSAASQSATTGTLSSAAQASTGQPAAPSQQSAPNQPVITQPTGLPQSRNFNTTLDQQLELLNRDVAAGRISSQDYVAGAKNINMMRQEGVHEAIDLMAQGQYQEAIDRFNSVGTYRDARLIKAQDGTTLINGVEQPTKLVTLAGRDGPMTIDTTQAQYQMLAADQRMALADKAANTRMMDQHYQRDDAVHMKQADTMEGYRIGQEENFRQQRLLEEMKIRAMGNQQAPIWNEKDDNYLQKIYTQPDPTTGAQTLDPTGASFARKVAQAQARGNGGDTMSGIDYAYQTDLQLKKAAGGDPDKLAQLRAGYLTSIAPKVAPASPSGNAPSAPSTNSGSQPITLSGDDPDAPGGDTQGIKGAYSRDQIAQIAAANNEPGLLAQYDRQVASDKRAAAGNQQGSSQAQAAAPTSLLTTRGGLNIAEENKKIALMNQLSGADRSRRASVIQAATYNVNKDLPAQLATIKPGASRADRQNFSNWYDNNSGYMTRAQIIQIRNARLAAGW